MWNVECVNQWERELIEYSIMIHTFVKTFILIYLCDVLQIFKCLDNDSDYELQHSLHSLMNDNIILSYNGSYIQNTILY